MNNIYGNISDKGHIYVIYDLQEWDTNIDNFSIIKVSIMSYHLQKDDTLCIKSNVISEIVDEIRKYFYDVKFEYDELLDDDLEELLKRFCTAASDECYETAWWSFIAEHYEFKTICLTYEEAEKYLLDNDNHLRNPKIDKHYGSENIRNGLDIIKNNIENGGQNGIRI